VLQLIPEEQKIKTKGTEWLSKADLEKKLIEQLSEVQYQQFVTAMDRLLAHPFAHKCKPFIEGLRKSTLVDEELMVVPMVRFYSFSHALVQHF
jgi:small subunit ribosomal protein S9